MTPIEEIHAGNIYAASIDQEWFTCVVKLIDGETIKLKGRCLNKEDAPSFFSATPDQLVPIPMISLSSLYLKYEKYWNFHSTIKNKEITFKPLDGGRQYLFVGRDTETGVKYVHSGYGVSDYLNFLRKMDLIEEADTITKLFAEKYRLE